MPTAAPALSAALDRAGLVELLAELVRIPSHPGVERQEEGVARALARYLSSRGLEPRLDEAAPGRPNVLCSVKGPRPGRRLVLCGHIDTVPLNASDPGAGFSAEVRDGRMHGRGTADMKGGVAAMAAALAALHESRGLEAGEVLLAAVADEEMESIGAERLVKSGLKADGAIIGEPTGNALHLGHKGLEWLEIVFTGRAAHGGTPKAGVNAIAAAARFVELVNELLVPRLDARAHPLLGAPTINFGTIQGGDQPSTVAARCVLTADRRSVPGETYESMIAELREILDEVESRMPGLKTSVGRVPGGMATLEHVGCVVEERHPLPQAVIAACASAGLGRPVLGSFPAWSDAALLSSFAGVPSVVLGPGDLKLAHSPYESVPLEEVRAAARIYAETALAFCRAA